MPIANPAGWTIIGVSFAWNGSTFDLTFDRDQYRPSIQDAANFQSYYVSATTGTSGGTGADWDNALDTPARACTKAAADGKYPKILIEGGQTYTRPITMPAKIEMIGTDRGLGGGAVFTFTVSAIVFNATYGPEAYVENCICLCLPNVADVTSWMGKNVDFQGGTATGLGSGDNTYFHGAGIVILEDCTASDSVSGDGYNYENTISFFEINCTASNNGSDIADNGSTAHQSATGIRYSGTYTNNWRNIHDVNESQIVIVDCTANTSQTGGADPYESFNVGSGMTGTSEACSTTIYGGNVSGGAVTDLWADSDGEILVSDLSTYAIKTGATVYDFTYLDRVMPETLGLITGTSQGTAIDSGANDTKPGYTTLGTATTDFAAIILSMTDHETALKNHLIDVGVSGTLAAENIIYKARTTYPSESILIPFSGSSGDTIQINAQTSHSSNAWIRYTALLLAAADVPFTASNVTSSYGADLVTSLGSSCDPGGTANTEVKTEITTSGGLDEAINYLNVGLVNTSIALAIGTYLIKVYIGPTGATDTGLGWEYLTTAFTDGPNKMHFGTFVDPTVFATSTRVWLGVQSSLTTNNVLESTIQTWQIDAASGGAARTKRMVIK